MGLLVVGQRYPLEAWDQVEGCVIGDNLLVYRQSGCGEETVEVGEPVIRFQIALHSNQGGTYRAGLRNAVFEENAVDAQYCLLGLGGSAAPPSQYSLKLQECDVGNGE